MGRAFAPRQFPRVRELRFWREEPGHAVFADLDELQLAKQIERLYLPSLRSADDVRNVQSALDEMPALRTVVIARCYAEHAGWGTELRHPTATIELPTEAYPWPPRDAITEIAFDSLQISLDVLVEVCEEHYEDLESDARTAWDALWDAVRASRTASGAWLGLRSLARAVIAPGRTTHESFDALQGRLRLLDDEALGDTVRVRWLHD